MFQGDRVSTQSQGGHRWVAHFWAPNRVLALGTLVVAAGLIPWIVFLAFTLPHRYTARHWRLLWIGYDVAEVAVLILVAWTAWFRRQVLGTVALVAAILLFCDAWFDIVTSWGGGDQWAALATGLGAEIPLGLFFLWLYRQLILRSLTAFHTMAHDGVVTTRLFDAPFVFLQGASEPTAVQSSPSGARSPSRLPVAAGERSMRGNEGRESIAQWMSKSHARPRKRDDPR